MVKHFALILLTLLAVALTLIALQAASSDSGAGYIHLAFLWFSGAIATLTVALAVQE